MQRSDTSLRRRRARREPRARFVLFCEGKNTEPAYFAALKHACSSTLVAITVVPAVGVPYTIAERAVDYAKSTGLDLRTRRRRDSFEESDQVWAVFDRDTHPRFKDAITLCGRYGIRVAYSNPCFELWLLLHEMHHRRYEDCDEIQSILGNLRPEYDKNGRKIANCKDLIGRVNQAEERAMELWQRRQQADDRYGNPSTTVGRLTRAIRIADNLARG